MGMYEVCVGYGVCMMYVGMGVYGVCGYGAMWEVYGYVWGMGVCMRYMGMCGVWGMYEVWRYVHG